MSLALTCTSSIFVQAKSLEPPTIIAPRAITVDMETKEIIYSKDADVKAQPASTTKLMTALLLAENKNKDDVLPVTTLSMEQESSSIFADFLPILTTADSYTADTIMKGLLLHSGNDMACIIAESISGSVDEFAKLMNAKAQELSMNDTNFYTPSGLDTKEILNGNEHYTTAYNLALLGMAAFHNDWVRETMALKENIEISTTAGNSILIKNSNKNLGLNGCIGGKTGFTSLAGRCLVGIYERDGRQIIGVVMGSTYPEFFQDMESIINYSYDISKEKLYLANEEIQSEPVAFKPLKIFGSEKTYNVPIIAKEDISQYNNEINNSDSTTNIQLNKINPWDLNEETVVGTLTLTERDTTKTYNLYPNMTTGDFINDNKNLYTNIFTGVICTIVVLIVLLFIFIAIRFKKSRKGMFRR